MRGRKRAAALMNPPPQAGEGRVGANPDAGASARRLPMQDTTVAIVGAGIGGVYLAAELGMLGCRLRLHDVDDSRLVEIRARGGIEVEGHGFAAIEQVTTELAAAVQDADAIVIVTGGNAQPTVARSL